MHSLEFLIKYTSVLCALVVSVRGSPIPLLTISEEASLTSESPVFTLPDAEEFVLLLPEQETIKSVPTTSVSRSTLAVSTTSTSIVDMTQTSGLSVTTSVDSTISMDAKTSVELATNDEDSSRSNTDSSSGVNLTTKSNHDLTNDVDPTTSNLDIHADVKITTASNENATDEELTTSSNILGQTDLNNKKSRIIRSLTTEPAGKGLTTESSRPELSLNREVLDRTYRASRQLQTRVDVQYRYLMSELSLSILSEFHVEAAYSMRPSLPDEVKINAKNCRYIQAVLESIKGVTLQYLPYANDFSSTAIRDSLYSVAWNINKLLPTPTFLPTSVPASGKSNSIDLIYTLLALQHQTQVISETLFSLQQCH